ncbi:polyhydroxyalkanoate synthesis repressor PhaR [Lysobacter sp. GX 14042]|uniref:polyhydroxyalkanoate synthesis repressor PhaR n=1 Tax=Lysobacter sp. GX 14042 TaxID=2907155 RepID=UPI001F42BE3A|nr:polyhydroxyalkanoate synthesis repressor PhaR [Lysobacter sp. GX 14042]MCE7032808.1 polyhydroxyalkanoate synthesis repressor PhaR [Lysobacter sp. GX 14042]
MRLIKKYPNRRLYDTEISSYITIEDVRQLIVEGEAFQVCDARSGDDLTRQVLLQVIAEHEQGGSPLLSPALLMRLARLHGDARQGEVARCLEDALDRLGAPPAPAPGPERAGAAATSSVQRPAPSRRAQAQNLTGSFGPVATMARRPGG